MQLSPRLERLLVALGVDAARVPAELVVPAPFGQTVPETDALMRWLGERGAERISVALCAGPPFDPWTVRLRDEALTALARRDAVAAAQHAATVSAQGPLEATLRLGALARMSALVAARAAEADEAVLAMTPLLAAPRPVARMVALRLGEVGVTEGALGRRARAVLEEALSDALQAAHALGASGHLAAVMERRVAELAMPGMAERADAATGRVVDLVAVLGALAAHREGLTQRLSALAPQAPPFVAPAYVVAYLAALGAADRGPYLDEVHARLLRAAADAEPRVRALAIEALGIPARDTPALVDALVDALTDAADPVRTAAALALAEVGVVPDAAARELEDMIELGEAEEALAATRALARCGRVVPAGLLAELDDPLVRASARLLACASVGDDDTFRTLVDAYADAGPEGASDLDDRLQPRTILVETLQAMPLARSAAWLARFAAEEPGLDAVGEVFHHALEDIAHVPEELVAAGRPLVEALAHGDDERAALTALVVARLVPGEPRLEALIVERTEPPVSLIALASLEHLSDDTRERLLAVVDEPADEYAALAVAALARCDLDAAQAAGLAAHIRDDDPLADVAHDALLGLVERGALA